MEGILEGEDLISTLLVDLLWDMSLRRLSLPTLGQHLTSDVPDCSSPIPIPAPIAPTPTEPEVSPSEWEEGGYGVFLSQKEVNPGVRQLYGACSV